MNLKEQLKKLLTDMRAIAAKAEEEKREFTAEERQQLTQMAKDAADLKAKIKAAEGDEALRKSILDLGAGIDLNDQPPKSQPAAGRAGRGQTIGERFVESPEFKAWMKLVAPGGQVPESARGLMSPAVQFGSLLKKDLVTGSDDTSAGAFVQTDYTGIYEPLGRIPLVLRDIISIRTTTSDLVEFVRQTRARRPPWPRPTSPTIPGPPARSRASSRRPASAGRRCRRREDDRRLIPATKRALSDAAQLRRASWTRSCVTTSTRNWRTRSSMGTAPART